MGTYCNTGPSRDTEIIDRDLERQREAWRRESQYDAEESDGEE